MVCNSLRCRKGEGLCRCRMKKRETMLLKRIMAAVFAGAVIFMEVSGGVRMFAASDYFSMVETEITLMVAESDFVEVDLAPDIAYTETDLTWASSDPEIVSVNSEGVITGEKEGTAVVTASMPDGSSENCSITVSGYMNETDDPNWYTDETEKGNQENYIETPDFTSLTLPKQLTVFVGEESFMDLSYEPQEADEETITWKSSNPGVATVDNSGLVTGIKTGTVKIFAMTDNNLTATCTLTVQKPQIYLEKSKAKLKIGRKIQIHATCSPDAKPTFKSQNKAVAKVTSKGLVKAKKRGKTVIIVKANGVSKKFNVTVVR